MKTQKHQSHLQKHNIIAATLEDILNHTGQGARLPGIREIMRRSGCGRPVTVQELHRLTELGLLQSLPRRGFFKVGVPSNPQKIVILHNTLDLCDRRGFFAILFDAIRTLAETHGYKISFAVYHENDEKDFQSFSRNLGSDKVFLLGQCSAAFARKVHAAFRYCVELLPLHETTIGSEIRDSPEMTALQLNYLFQLGYRKIGYLHHVEKECSRSPVEFHRLFDFYRIMAEHGFRIEPEWVFYAPWAWSSFERAAVQLFALKDIPEAVIISGGRALRFFYRFCGNRGIEIGRDIGVMATDDVARDLRPRPTTTTNDPAVIAADAWTLMEQRINGQIAVRTTQLFIRQGSSIRRGVVRK